MRHPKLLIIESEKFRRIEPKDTTQTVSQSLHKRNQRSQARTLTEDGEDDELTEPLNIYGGHEERPVKPQEVMFRRETTRVQARKMRDMATKIQRTIRKMPRWKASLVSASELSPINASKLLRDI